MVEEIQQQPQQQQDLSQIDSELRQQQQDLRTLQKDLREKRKYAKTVTISVGGQEKIVSPDAALRDIEVQKRRITATRSDIKQHIKDQETQEAIQKTPYYKAVSGTAEPTYSGVETETRTPEEAEAYQLQQEISKLKAQQPPQSRISKALSVIARKGFDITEQIGEKIKKSPIFTQPMTFDVVGAGKRTFRPGESERLIGKYTAGLVTTPPALLFSAIATVPVVESLSRKPIQIIKSVPKGLTIAGGLILKSIKKDPKGFAAELLGGYKGVKLVEKPISTILDIPTKVIGKKFVPTTAIIEPALLAGKVKFPSVKVSKGASLLKEFESLKYKQPFLMKGETGGFHATVGKVEPKTRARAGTSETPGFYIAPSLSKHFLRLTESKTPSFSLTPTISKPPLALFIKTKVGRLPKSILSKSFKEASQYLDIKAQRGKAYISPAFEILKKTEKEAIIPRGSILESIKGKPTHFTFVEGRVVPIEIFKTKLGTKISKITKPQTIKTISKKYDISDYGVRPYNIAATDVISYSLISKSRLKSKYKISKPRSIIKSRLSKYKLSKYKPPKITSYSKTIISKRKLSKPLVSISSYKPITSKLRLPISSYKLKPIKSKPLSFLSITSYNKIKLKPIIPPRTKPFQPTKTKDKPKKKPKGFKLLFGKRKIPQIFTKVHAIEKGITLFKKQPKVKEFKLKKVLGTPKRLTHIKKQVKLRREGLTFKRRI